jgi:hypothetical protein
VVIDRPHVPVSASAVTRLGLAAALAIALGACGAESPVSPNGTAVPGSLNMNASDWTFEYSPNMPRHPHRAAGGWQFDFPTREGVGYLTTSQRPASVSDSISAKISIDTVGDPFFEFRTEASNTCPGHATVRLYFQRRGDDMTGAGGFEFYRWWSNPVAYELGSGSVDLVGDLGDPSRWTSVFGRSGAGHESSFHAALADLGAVGFTFGGGCFFGHGVYVTPGTGQAVFTASEYAVR